MSSGTLLSWYAPLALAALSLGASTVPAPIRIAGSAELTYAKQEALPVGGAEQHILMLAQTKGINKNAGPTDYFSDAEVTNVELADLDQGNGRHQGYYTMTKGGSSATARWEGKVRTVGGGDGPPQTSFSGTWEYVAGSGEYEGIKGKGTYEGRFLAKDRLMVSWKGQYTK